MPGDAILVSAAIVAMFAVFAAVLFWGDMQTRSLQQGGGTAQGKRRSF
jgi:hypothetical protein